MNVFYIVEKYIKTWMRLWFLNYLNQSTPYVVWNSSTIVSIKGGYRVLCQMYICNWKRLFDPDTHDSCWCFWDVNGTLKNFPSSWRNGIRAAYEALQIDLTDNGEDKAKTLHFLVQVWNLSQLFLGMVKNFMAQIPKDSGPYCSY